jgi:hypothetical protein
MPEPLILFLLASLAIFIAGGVAGRELATTETIFTRSNLRITVGILVTIVWVGSIVAEIVIPAYTVSVLIHGIMGAVVGYLFSDDGLNINIGGDGGQP